jgi:nicotinate-nucleotide--dimethylbenzimidazole phosphoribosyltransferase
MYRESSIISYSKVRIDPIIRQLLIPEVIMKTNALIHIEPLNAELQLSIRAELDRKTKPPRSLGRLEDLAAQIAGIQERVKPSIESAQVFVIAGDHGIAQEGVSAYPQAVTAQMVLNFLSGGAAISVLAKANDAKVTVVDAGVAEIIPPHENLLDRKIAFGTNNFLHESAMSLEQVDIAIQYGKALSENLPKYGALILGEMGIANTTSASALMHGLTRLPLTACIGRGTGVDDQGLLLKQKVIAEAFGKHAASNDSRELLSRYGGFEIAMMCGAMLGAAQARQIIIVDGFIASVAACLAIHMQAEAQAYMVFSHVSAEAPHRALLESIGAKALLDWNMRLGEGSGAILVLPLLRSACAMLSNMATFASAGVSEKAAK